MHVGSINGTVYLPMELTAIKAQACPNSKKLTDVQTAAMIKRTAVPPKERQKCIVEGLKKIFNNDLNNDSMAKEFSISVVPDMTVIKSRVLDPPSLMYAKSDAQKTLDVPQVKPVAGKWNMPPDAHYVKAMELIRWGLLYLSDPTRYKRGEQEISFDQQVGASWNRFKMPLRNCVWTGEIREGHLQRGPERGLDGRPSSLRVGARSQRGEGVQSLAREDQAGEGSGATDDRGPGRRQKRPRAQPDQADRRRRP
jgi:hypothetical protein